MPYEIGTTIRLKLTTKDFSGAVADADSNPTVSVWDGGKTQRLNAAPSTKIAPGTYIYDLTLEESWALGSYLVEWRAAINNKPLVSRTKISVERTQ